MTPDEIDAGYAALAADEERNEHMRSLTLLRIEWDSAKGVHVAPKAAEQPGPSRVVILLEYPGGAFQEIAAAEPLGFRLAVEASDRSTMSEPVIVVAFSGNPEAGGVTVRKEGVVP